MMVLAPSHVSLHRGDHVLAVSSVSALSGIPGLVGRFFDRPGREVTVGPFTLVGKPERDAGDAEDEQDGDEE